MKIRSLILSLVLGCFSLFSVFTLVGCGEKIADQISENFTKLDEVYQANSTVFYEGEIEGFQTKYIVDYGAKVNGYVLEHKAGYLELYNTYNAILALSNDCVDGNRNYILSFFQEDGELSKETESALKDMNKSLEDYILSVEEFSNARRTFVEYFEAGGDFSTDSDNIYLRKFKRSYGEMVGESVKLSKTVAKCIETREFLELVQETTVEETEVEIVKEYIRAKMIPIFSDMIISKIENNLNWNAYADVQEEVKTRIDGVISNLQTFFETYKTEFVGAKNCKAITQDAMKDLIEKTENFFVEADYYFYALENFDIDKLVVEFNFDMEKYLEQDKLAEVYLSKIEQFAGTTLPAFIAEVSSIIY